jgi:hypothetical protein
VKKLEVYLDGDRVMEIEADDFVLNAQHEWEELRSNPAMFAAIAGADPEELMKLPGEQVAMMQHGGELTIDWRVRVRWIKPRMGEFRPASR